MCDWAQEPEAMLVDVFVLDCVEVALAGDTYTSTITLSNAIKQLNLFQPC